MFLKSVNNFLYNLRSISGQLTLFYSASTFILITIISLVLYCGMINVLYNADRQFLSDEIDIVQNILAKNPDNSQAIKQEVVEIPRSLKSRIYVYYIRILDKTGKIITITPDMNKVNQNNSFFNDEKDSLPNKISRWLKLEDGNYYLLMQSKLTVKKEDKLWHIQIALDVTYQQTIINRYRRNVYFIILGGALLSVLLGYLISRRGMRRLYEITAMTKNITTNALQQRINPEVYPKELNELVIAYNQMLDRIQCSISRLTALSDDLAHELRTPISNLMGEAELALSRNSTSDEYKQVIQSSLEELDRIHQIIENLLFLAHAENPQMDLQKTTLNILDEIKIMCRFYQAVADDKNIRFHFEGQGFVYANSIMLRRMIGNIISNALKHAKNDSLISVHIKDTDHHYLNIKFIDTGHGIPTEDLSKLFQRFYRVDSSRTQHTGGTGLGLAIVKSIIDLHHGKISINSIIDKGTTVDILLPKYDKTVI